MSDSRSTGDRLPEGHGAANSCRGASGDHPAHWRRALSALAFDLEHEQASRVQLVQTGERAFEVRAEIRPGGDVAAVFDKITAEVLDLLRDNGISDAVIRKSHQSPKLGDSGKFQEVVPIN